MDMTQRKLWSSFDWKWKNTITGKSGLIKLIIWCLGLGVLVGLTIKDFLPLLDDYRHNNVATQVRVVVVEPSFRPPQPLIHIPIYEVQHLETQELMTIALYLINGTMEECEICKKLKDKAWDVWKFMNVSEYEHLGIEALYEALSMEFTKLYYAVLETSQKNILDNKYSAWNQPIFSAVLNFITWQSHLDYYFANPDFGGNMSLFINNGKNLDMLLDGFLESICQKMRFTEVEFADEFLDGTVTNLTCRDLFLNRSHPIYINEYGIWLSLPAFSEPTIRSYVFTIPNTSLWAPKWKLEEFMFFPDISVNYVTIMDQVYSTMLYSSKPKSGGHVMTARYSIQIRARDERPWKSDCHNESSATVCFTKCTKMWIIKKCVCVPFSFKRGLDYNQSLQFCTDQDYLVCKPHVLPTKVRDKCIEKCRAACEYISYSWMISNQRPEPDPPDATEFNIKIMPSFSTFAEFAWTVKNTPEQFLSQIGGLLNFFLGVSGMSFFALLIMCIENARRWCQNEIHSKSSVEHLENHVMSKRKLGHADNEIAVLIRQEVKEEVKMVMEEFKMALTELTLELHDMKRRK